MGNTVLVLEFVDTAGKTKVLNINSPKADLTRKEVFDAMEIIINNDVILSNSKNHLADANNCYYRTTTKTTLVDDGGGE